MPDRYAEPLMFAGQDGNSLLCSCGAFAYVHPVTVQGAGGPVLTCVCGSCGTRHTWRPRRVECAHPRHNDACGNRSCFNYRDRVARRKKARRAAL